MAKTACLNPECGQLYHDRRDACPECGQTNSVRVKFLANRVRQAKIGQFRLVTGWLIFVVIVIMGISLWCYSSISEPFEAEVFSEWQSTAGGNYLCIRINDGRMIDVECITGVRVGCRRGDIVFGTINKRGGYRVIGVKPPKKTKEG